MEHQAWVTKQATKTRERLLPRCTELLRKKADKSAFIERFDREFPRLFRLLHTLYGDQYDFFYHLEQVVLLAARSYAERDSSLKKRDAQREEDPLWFQSEDVIGAVCYVDKFAGTLRDMPDKLDYINELNINYLHLMPLFKTSETNNDGGYAISDYRQVDPQLGTMDDLADLAQQLHGVGIDLALDFVFNHTSDEHQWAQAALAGDETYQDYYLIYPDRIMPNRYEATLREIFPEQAPGNFTYLPTIDKWVWTSFYNFQWDLNYSNPEVFTAMAGEMLFLANQGVDVLRLDALAFIWKQEGTASEGLPQAHLLIQAFNALTKIAAPAMVFKSEAIVHPAQVATYISGDECPLSYNPTLMALLWEALATRNVSLLQTSMARRFTIPDDSVWVNYIRVHDDIGWTFADEDAAELFINGYDHRQFLNYFYTGEFEGSFATGLPFGVNPQSGDMRISGTMASLAGLEQALQQNDDRLIEMAVRRMLLLDSVMISAGGIPLIYLGDEIATLNDYSWRDDLDKRMDSRWAHRADFDWERAEQRHDADTIVGRVFQGLQHMIDVRIKTPAMRAGHSTFFPTQNPHVLGYIRQQAILCLANFSERDQHVSRDVLTAYAPLTGQVRDLITDEMSQLPETITLEPYAFKWLYYGEDAHA